MNSPKRGKTNPSLRTATEVLHREFSVHYMGPIPPAAELARFEAISPGFADRILKLAEDSAAHRQAMEHIVIAGNTESQRRGQWMALGVATLVIALAGWLVHLGNVAIGAWLVLANLVTLAAAFLGAKWMQKKEREAKAWSAPPR